MRPNVISDCEPTNSTRKALLSQAGLTTIMFGLGILMIVPFLWMISTSLKKPIDVFVFPIQWIPRELQVQNYHQVWLNSVYPFYLFFYNSLKVAFLSIAGVLAVSSAAAYAFAKIEFKGKQIIFFLYLATMMIPQQVTLIPRFALFRWLGVFDTHWALILPSIFYVLGIFMLRQFYLGIPNELSEAAKIDGASHFRIWYRLIIPLSKPALVTLIILNFASSWNEYMNPLIFITSKDLYTIPVGLHSFLDEEGIEFNLFMAAATCAILPIISVFLPLQKYFIQGIDSTGLKG